LLLPSLDGQWEELFVFSFWLIFFRCAHMHSGKRTKTLTASWKLQSLCWRSLKFLARYVCMDGWMDGWCPSESLRPPLCLNHTVIDVVARLIN
jgi:hypothetical protein